MDLNEKLRQLKRETELRRRNEELERTLEFLRRLDQPTRKRLPAERVAKGIEEYVDGQVESNDQGEFFVASQALPFGRPYGKLRISDISGADLSALELFLGGTHLPEMSRLVCLDTETTGLAGGTGTCAWLIGLGAAHGVQFVVRQYFLRDYPEEKAILAALAEALEGYDGVITFNGKTFDIPLLETRYALARMKSPFPRLVHLDLLHPARRLWKLRLESCELQNLEKNVLGIYREGDVDGSEIPAIYFDYLRTGDPKGLAPVFYHNTLDIVTLAALSVELARAIANAGEQMLDSPLDLFSLSRIFDRAGAAERGVATCERALAAGLPTPVESHALQHLAAQYKRQRQHERAVALWLELSRRETRFALAALEELAIYYEHRQRDPQTALEFTDAALERLQGEPSLRAHLERFAHRKERLQKKVSRPANPTRLPRAPR